MKWFAFIGLLIVLLLCGCTQDGTLRHDVNTGSNGSLDGLSITPAPQSLGIATDTEFYLDWAVNTSPPSTFTVTLRKIEKNGDTHLVRTVLDTLSTGHYRLYKDWNLDTQSFYMLEIIGGGKQVRTIYLTGGTSGAQKRNSGEEKGEETHEVKLTIDN
ncbi:MAG: hypothetical protein WCO98_05050 [bacterium]